MFYTGIAVILFFDSHDSVVPFAVLFLSLFSFDDPDQPTSQQTTRKRRLVHQHQNVDRVTILGNSRRDKSEVVGESHTSRKHLFQLEDSLVRIEGIFVATAFWCFDDGLNNVGVGLVKRLYNNGILQALAVLDPFRHRFPPAAAREDCPSILLSTQTAFRAAFALRRRDRNQRLPLRRPWAAKLTRSDSLRHPGGPVPCDEGHSKRHPSRRKASLCEIRGCRTRQLTLRNLRKAHPRRSLRTRRRASPASPSPECCCCIRPA